jgi:prepilin-type N-terminal cleavage/methylation domain-containing protein
MKRHSKKNAEGFTLIEIMIVIAIIGILAAIAIPNYISYRDKSFCSAAESDTRTIASGLANYFAVASNQNYAGDTGPQIHFTGNSTIFLSGINTGTVAPLGSNRFLITVTDRTGRCPISYRSSNPYWSLAAQGAYSRTF